MNKWRKTKYTDDNARHAGCCKQRRKVSIVDSFPTTPVAQSPPPAKGCVFSPRESEREKCSHLTAEYPSLSHPLFLPTHGVALPPHPSAVGCLNKPRDVSVRSDRIRSHFVAETSDRKFAPSSYSATRIIANLPTPFRPYIPTSRPSTIALIVALWARLHIS